MGRALTAAFWDYDRTRRLADGRITIPGYDLSVTISAPEATFKCAAKAQFDISELSFSNSVTRLSQDALPYVMIPVFLSRTFRHSMIYVRTDRGISQPGDLRGKTIGVQEYDMTAAVVVRGFLRDQFGVFPEDMAWKVGEADGGVWPAFAGRTPEGVSVEILAAGTSLEERLLKGELDAMLALRPSPSLTKRGVTRLFPNPRAVEEEWFQKSGVFPIMHAVGIRKECIRDDPELPAKAYQAFLEAKWQAIDELETVQAPKVTLPWPAADVANARKLMGDDYWPYGVKQNKKALTTQLRWSWLDGLQKRRLSVDDLFAKSLYVT